MARRKCAKRFLLLLLKKKDKNLFIKFKKILDIILSNKYNKEEA